MSAAQFLPITIDEQPVLVESGLTILQAARQHGIDIPTLCDFPGLPAHGSCRLCIVEIQGRHNTPTACTTPVEAGMVIATHSPKVRALRTELIQMLLAEHPAGCLYCPEKDHCDECMVTLRKAGVTTGCGSCPKDNQCELQVLAAQYEVEKPAYPIHYRMLPVEHHNPFFDRDNNLCILCGRCIRVCDSLHFANTLTYSSRGTQAQVSTAFNRKHIDSNCTFCGSCVEVCPTGALTEKTRKWDGKPERETATTCPFCSIGCQIHLLSKGERVLGSLPNRSAGTQVLCVQGRFGVPELVNHATRLKQPQKLAGAIQQPTNWEEAVAFAAEILAACDPERFELRISADCTNEDLFVARQFAREVMKSGHITSSAQARYGSGLNSMARLLQDAGTLEMIGEASAVLCLGLDDPYAQSVVGVHLNRAKALGVKIIQLSSRKPSWSDSADIWLYAGQGQEIGLIHSLVELTGRGIAAPQQGDQAEMLDVGRAANLLQQPGTALIILGPAILADRDLLESVEQLKHNLGARAITLPDEANLVGALRLGLLGAAARPPEQQDLDVLYLIGEAVPAGLSGHPTIIAHSIVPPDHDFSDLAVDLTLPMTAFSEENGTFIDYAGRVRAIHPAVNPPGEALPSWMILARIAQKMGMPGFAYTCVEDIRQAAQAEFPGFPAETPSPALPLDAKRRFSRSGLNTLRDPGAGSQKPCFRLQPSPVDLRREEATRPAGTPTPGSRTTLIAEQMKDNSSVQGQGTGVGVYLGIPLATRVAGLNNLYPQTTNGSGHESNS